MCLYPRIIRNPKYLPNKKNGGYVPIPSDHRARFVAIGCGECIECRKQYSRAWRVRLMEEFKNNRQCSFVTLTFSEEKLRKYRELAQMELKDENYCDIYKTDNVAAKIAIRHFLERHRKKTGKSIRHWFITERGHTGTRRLHVHGLIWEQYSQAGRGSKKCADLTEAWGNGWTYNGDYVGEKTITYISKYITKSDQDNAHFKGKICTSPGIGKSYIESYNGQRNRYRGRRGKETIETYRLSNGKEIGLPMYYRQKIYTERQRESLWMNLLDKEERWVLGKRVDISFGRSDRYENAVKEARNVSKTAGYNEPEWATKNYTEDYRKKHKIIEIKSNLEFQYKNTIFANINENKTARHENCKNKFCTTLHEWRNAAGNQNLGERHNTGNHGSGQGENVKSWQGLCDDRNIGTEQIYGENTYMETKRIETTINNRINTYKNVDNRIKPRTCILNNNAAGCDQLCRNDIHGRGTEKDRIYMGEGAISERPERRGYQIVDIETGEIYTKLEYNRIKNQLKTISYDKNKRKGIRADGSRYTWFETKRFVKKVGADQLELDL